MSEPVLRVEQLGKKYSIWHQGQRQRYVALRDVIVDRFAHAARAAARPWRRQGRLEGTGSQGSRTEDFWALRHVTFELRQGEVLGVIGQNGAGKSTLLKILSRITQPTEGRVRMRGRVASLLEVGTGFHAELTGRENIHLNGAILGMSSREIRRKFDEIVAFAEVETFLDTPVKRYSSGMYVRLAFAVAAHLEPEILIVDEVLAVGDTAFQAKCMGKMREASRAEGRTVLFVSHNMGAIQSLCSRGIVLNRGTVAFEGDARNAVSRYLQLGQSGSASNVLDSHARTGSGDARVLSIRLEDGHSEPQTHFRMGEPVSIVMRVGFSRAIQNPTFGVCIVTDEGVVVSECRSSHADFKIGQAEGEVEVSMTIPSLLLYPRTYVLEPWVCDAGCLQEFDWVRNAGSMVVTSGPNFVNGETLTAVHGISYIPTSWKAAAPLHTPGATPSDDRSDRGLNPIDWHSRS